LRKPRTGRGCKRWTRNGSWGNDDYLRLAYQAYSVRQARRSAGDSEFDSLWNSAEQAAASNSEHDVALARLASKWDLASQAELLWLRVAKVPATRREALDALYQIYRKRNDLPNLRSIAQRLHESSPEETGLASNAARLALLLDRNTAAGRELARQTYEKAPNETGTAVTYAFALYGVGRTAEGVAVLNKIPPEQLRDSHTAVYACTSSGRRQPDRRCQSVCRDRSRRSPFSRRETTPGRKLRRAVRERVRRLRRPKPRQRRGNFAFAFGS
jgi:hypothetical protein